MRDNLLLFTTEEGSYFYFFVLFTYFLFLFLCVLLISCTLKSVATGQGRYDEDDLLLIIYIK